MSISQNDIEKTFKANIQEVVNDHTHGSSHLLGSIIDCFSKYKVNSSLRAWAFNALSQISKAMVIIHHFLSSIQPEKEDFYQQVENYKQKWRNVEVDIARSLSKQLKSHTLKILTHSHSGTIIKVLKYLSTNNFKITVYQTISEPGGEGKNRLKHWKKLELLPMLSLIKVLETQ